jgi:hypothetical protein
MSIFTRRHYVWLASVARDARREALGTTENPLVLEGVDFAISSFATALASESDGFDKTQFLHNVYGPFLDNETSEHEKCPALPTPSN